ncbi:MAG TPA: HEAT repeat domain-containing protein, partial [Candidatus Kapabacteria bacterium]|nr:HEAT repeat domain-containing protein [Candidatus Kapabacteria bacterium]
IIFYRRRIVAHERKVQELRGSIIDTLSEILSEPPPRALPSSVEYKKYIQPLAEKVLSIVRDKANECIVLNAALLEFMTHLNGEARVRVEQIYAACGFMDDAIQRLASPHWWERANAVRELRISRPNDALNPLCDMLMDPNPDVVLEALYAVLDTGGVKMIPRIVHVLPHMSQLEEMYIIDLCMRSGFECIEYVIPLLDDKRSDVKRFAIHALGAIHSAEHVPVIIPFLSSGNRWLVLAALDALGYIASDKAVGKIEKLCFRRDPQIQVKAAVTLRRIGGVRSAEILILMLEDEDSTVRGAASNALAKLLMKQVFDSGSPAEALAYYKTRSFQSRGAL